ncbi:ABC transporter ATP-binding protein [Desulfospira joergensenii]|uniref:ABC transporter ATP-binding protein n=1 Tax=Desulfospira joergensenii TaxID=53329 RepID=UPI0003B732A5|nr:ABC transporter ATP-binding protein [Desulfospira joergensenii]
MDIQIQNISFTYGDRPVLEDLSTEFQQGTFYAILGPNGSGKTTLLDLISGFLLPDRGSVLVDHRSISAMSKLETARMISLVSQNHEINFPFTVGQVVMMGRHPYIDRFGHPSQTDRDRVNQVMMDTGIFDLRERKVTELSGGEKQRCVVARALCQNTPVLLLDEAFSNLDINHTLHILDMVKNSVLTQNKIIIAVLHDLNLASAWADELLFLKNGEIRAAGPTRDVLTRETIENVFQVKSKVEFNEYLQARQAYFKKA